MITSAANKKVKNIASLLSRSRERKKQGIFVVEGIKMFTEVPIDRLLEIYIEETLFKEVLAGKADEEFVKKLDQITGCLPKKDGRAVSQRTTVFLWNLRLCAMISFEK